MSSGTAANNRIPLRRSTSATCFAQLCSAIAGSLLVGVSVGNDRGAGDVAFVLLDEGLLDRLERELVRDDLVPRIAPAGARHHVERPAQVLGLVVREADDAAVAEDDPGRIELGLPAHVDIADLEIRALRCGHA